MVDYSNGNGVFFQREIKNTQLKEISNRIRSKENTTLDLNKKPIFAKKYIFSNDRSKTKSMEIFIYDEDWLNLKTINSYKYITEEMTFFHSLLTIEELDPGNIVFPLDLFLDFKPKHLYEWLEIFVSQGGKLTNEVLKLVEKTAEKQFHDDCELVMYLKKKERMANLIKLNNKTEG